MLADYSYDFLKYSSMRVPHNGTLKLFSYRPTPFFRFFHVFFLHCFSISFFFNK